MLHHSRYPFIQHIAWFDLQDAAEINDYPSTVMDFVFLLEGGVEVGVEGKSTEVLPCSFYGLYNKRYNIKCEENTRAIHVRFKARDVYPIINVPLHETVNQQIGLEDLIGKESLEIWEKLAESNSKTEQASIIESWLISKYNPEKINHRIQYGLELIEACEGRLSVKMLSEQLHVNYKSLDRWFNKIVGISPKQYIQLTKFKHILTRMNYQKDTDWIQLADDFNFHDQSHFINFFKGITGVSPTSFHK